MITAPRFEGFDFGLLDRDDFLEDSVREELVAPLLSALGYSASPPHRIIRSMHLQHPYVFIGSVKKPINIIPDYVLQRDGENAWVLDAKGPNEVIDSGKNVEQAYSYAIHRDVCVPFYALCNGRRLTVFHVSQWPAIFNEELQSIERYWRFLLDLLGTEAAWPEGHRAGFLPDLGLALRKAGLDRDENGKKYFQIFESVPAHFISKVEDDLYSVSARYRQEVAKGQFTLSMLTFDFDFKVYEEQFLPSLPDSIREHVRSALTRQPYAMIFEESEVPLLLVVAWPGDAIRKNENESYCPFIVEEFHPMG